MAMPGTETIRFRRPTAGPNAVKQSTTDKFGGKHAPDVQKWRRRHMGLLQDLVGRQANGPFMPSLSLAVRLLLLVRVSAAMYSNIQDCDEVFNYFEPLHYFSTNTGFQTWESSPEFAIRSWAYVIMHWPLAWLAPLFLKVGKRTAFFCLRISLGIICSICEAKFYRSVAENINERVGRYTLVGLIGSAGMWGASTAFLPSSFSLYTTLLAISYALRPASSDAKGNRWALMATLWFAIGGILGWPFSLLLAIPFVIEQLFVRGSDIVPPDVWSGFFAKRVTRLVKYGALASTVAIPVIAIDSWAYGRWTFPALNIVLYNVFSNAGPELYGTESGWFYFLNLGLNFNLLFVLALSSLPALVITYFYDFRRLGVNQRKPTVSESSPFLLLALRLAPFYLWFGVLSVQAHKEERFMFPVYGLLCFNSAVTVFLVRGWAETTFVKITSSSYRASKTRLFSYITLALTLLPLIISASRIFALGHYYHSPLSVIHAFQYREIPLILEAAGYKPVPPPKDYEHRADQVYEPEWDYAPLETMEPKVRLCWGKEWYRYPSSFLIPEGVEVRWIRSEFDGAMPLQWRKSIGESKWGREETRVIEEGRFNNMNRANDPEDAFVDPSTCTHLIDSLLPSQPPTALEPAYALSPDWERIMCDPFLDAASTKWWARIGWLPGDWAEKGRVWGEYCLLRRKVEGRQA